MPRHLLVGVQNGTNILRKSLTFSCNKPYFLYEPEIAILAMTQAPGDMKTRVHNMTCTQMFRASLVVIAQNWKRENGNFVVYCYTEILYDSHKKNDLWI